MVLSDVGTCNLAPSVEEGLDMRRVEGLPPSLLAGLARLAGVAADGCSLPPCQLTQEELTLLDNHANPTPPGN